MICSPLKKKLFHQNLKQIQDIEIGNLHSLTKNVYFLFSVYLCFSILGQLNSAINIEIIRIAKLLKTSQSFNAMIIFFILILDRCFSWNILADLCCLIQNISFNHNIFPLYLPIWFGFVKSWWFSYILFPVEYWCHHTESKVPWAEILTQLCIIRQTWCYGAMVIIRVLTIATYIMVPVPVWTLLVCDTPSL